MLEGSISPWGLYRRGSISSAVIYLHGLSIPTLFYEFEIPWRSLSLCFNRPLVDDSRWSCVCCCQIKTIVNNISCKDSDALSDPSDAVVITNMYMNTKWNSPIWEINVNVI